MAFSQTQLFKQQRLALGTLETATHEAQKQTGVDKAQILIDASYNHADGFSENKNLTIADLASIDQVKDKPSQLTLNFIDQGTQVLFVLLYDQGDKLAIYVSAQSPEICRMVVRIFVAVLHLEPNESSTLPLPPETKEKNHKTPNKVLAPEIATSALNDLPPSDLPVPEKVTLAWLFKHIPAWLWFSAFGTLFVAFVTGLKLGQLKLFQDILDAFK